MSQNNLPFKEDFLQFVWKFRLFNAVNLTTYSGEQVEIIHQGQQNTGSGPDFENAKIKIDDTIWVGNVEIHLTNQEWYNHRHQLDKAYNNVILHVVFDGSNEPVVLENSRKAPTILLENRIFDNTLAKYKAMMLQKPQIIPCEKLIDTSESFVFSQYYERLVFERLERKVKDIENDLKFTKGSLDDAFLIALFKYFGAPANKQPFEMLARSFSLHQLIKQATSVKQIEAMLFGLAGFLDGSDDYSRKLENEFEYLKSLYKFDSILDKSHWKFSNVRPPNFPTIRIAQLAALLFSEQRLLNVIIEETDIENIKNRFKANVSEYWQTHYLFGKVSGKKQKPLTEAFVNKILINVVAPFLFFYGNYKADDSFKEKAVDLLMAVDAEENSIVSKLNEIGLPCENAFDSQALIELKTLYCNEKKCLQCRIGYGILKS